VNKNIEHLKLANRRTLISPPSTKLTAANAHRSTSTSSESNVTDSLRLLQS
jgi:hypothetical protein